MNPNPWIPIDKPSDRKCTYANWCYEVMNINTGSHRLQYSEPRPGCGEYTHFRYIDLPKAPPPQKPPTRAELDAVAASMAWDESIIDEPTLSHAFKAGFHEAIARERKDLHQLAGEVVATMPMGRDHTAWNELWDRIKP